MQCNILIDGSGCSKLLTTSERGRVSQEQRDTSLACIALVGGALEQSAAAPIRLFVSNRLGDEPLINLAVISELACALG